MYTKIRNALGVALSVLSFPAVAHAQGASNIVIGISSSPIVLLGAFIIFAIIFARFAMGAINVCFLEDESIASIERRHPYLPSVKMVIGMTLVTVLLFFLSLKTINGIAPFDGPNGWKRAALMFVIFGIVAIISKLFWPKKSSHYVFGAIVGTIITFAILGFKQTIFSGGAGQDPFIMTLGIICLIIGWHLLFGPWRPQVKAFVLGTFIFWMAMHIFFRESQAERLAHLLAVIIALIPAVIWCFLFLGYHRQRLSMVILMFFSGMLSTAPILLYDKILRSGMELQFFLFRIVPESFQQSSNAFVSGRAVGITGYKSTIVATLISFLLVGLIEELSKFWVLKKSGRSSFTSIDDVIQLGIIVAIGFAFAENILNPNYFLAFVSEHLVQPNPDWSGFLGNFLGRSILTNMVHIVSTGVLGYYFGIVLFTRSYLREEQKESGSIFIPRFLHHFFRLPEEEVFKREMIIFGLVIAIALHGIFNFLVTLPSILPGNPKTLGELFNASAGSPLHYIAILVIPSLFYIVGGFWLLSALFTNKRCMRERGHLVRTDTLITGKVVA